MRSKHKIISELVLILVGALFIDCLELPSVQAASTSTNSSWQDTGITIASYAKYFNTNSYFCFDATSPGVLLSKTTVSTQPVVEAEATTRYNWQTGEKRQISSKAFESCNPYTGQVFGWDLRAKPPAYFRLDTRTGVETTIKYNPSLLARDGTGRLYAWVPNGDLSGSKLYYSPDNGITWEERGQLLNGKQESPATITLLPASSGILYAVVRERTEAQPNPIDNKHIDAIYFSEDGGFTWSKRSELTSQNHYCNNSLSVDTSEATPANLLILTERCWSPKTQANQINKQAISSDGGRTFVTIGTNQESATDWNSAPLYFTGKSFIQVSGVFQPYLRASEDFGKTWKNLDLPYKGTEPSANPIRPAFNFYQPAAVPNNLFLGNADGSGDLWHSADGGYQWQNLGENMEVILMPPYSPRLVLGIKQNKLYYRDLPTADKALTNRRPDSGVPNNTYYPQTGHNLPGIFRNYWQQNGGLAQFGYPLTEPFLEINPSDGKIYSVQYFERNRFEHHPEYAGTKYEVLLGLLGNQLTETQRKEKQVAFEPVDAKPNARYFPEVRHTLQGVFRNYWEQNGGLAMYGSSPCGLRNNWAGWSKSSNDLPSGFG